jgi:hypothetical protein
MAPPAIVRARSSLELTNRQPPLGQRGSVCAIARVAHKKWRLLVRCKNAECRKVPSERDASFGILLDVFD